MAGVVILALIIGGVALFMRGRNADNAGGPSGNLPGVGDLPPFGAAPPPSAPPGGGGFPIGFPQMPASPNPIDQAVRLGASVFTPISSKEKQVIAGFAVNPLLMPPPTALGISTDQEFSAYLNAHPELLAEAGISPEQAREWGSGLPPRLEALMNKPGGLTVEDLQKAQQDAQAQFDVLNQKLNAFEGGSPMSPEQCEVILAEANQFVADWGIGSVSPSTIGIPTSCPATQLPLGFPGL